MKIKNLLNTKKRFVAVAAAGALLAAGAGIAAAVFTGTGTGTGAGAVGALPAGLTVTPVTAAGTLTPPTTPGGTSSQVLTFKLSNGTTKGQTIVATSSHATIVHGTVAGTSTVVVTGTGGSAKYGTSIAGCYTYWFTLTSPTTISYSESYVAAHTTGYAYVTLHMPYSATTQNACATIHPEVSLTVKTTS